MTILTDLFYCFVRVHFRRYFSWSEVMLRACLILKMKYATNSNLKEHIYNFVKVSNHWHLKLFSGLVDGSVIAAFVAQSGNLSLISPTQIEEKG